jgi:formylglycine-generating enzyme required for sulfatase activity
MRARAAVPDPLLAELESARRFLQQALAPVPDRLWSQRPSPAYSPIGWHLGHVAAVQVRWLLPGEPQPFDALFDPAATAKPARGRLPEPDQLRALLDDVLERVSAGLRAGRVPGVLGLPESFLVQHVAQHELQHAEHVQVIAALCEKRLHRMPNRVKVSAAGRLELDGGPALVGSADRSRAYDNECPQHEIRLGAFWLDRAPVTAGEFARFVEAGGYRQKEHWGPDSWDWRTEHDVRAPRGFREQDPDGPVTCLSWHEADAYARWRGARLPTEHELEVARVPPAGVWEWTSSWFLPYPGFRPYPYERYSVPWFRTHRVLRGGSWATSPELVRPSFRNWYDAGLREIPSGFRCAGGL